MAKDSVIYKFFRRFGELRAAVFESHWAIEEPLIPKLVLLLSTKWCHLMFKYKTVLLLKLLTFVPLKCSGLEVSRQTWVIQTANHSLRI